MIVNVLVVVDLSIALFALSVGAYAAYKAYRIEQAGRTVENDKKYGLEKDFYLVSTVGWMTLGTRILAIPLFFATVISLIPSVPGAMCEFGVFQAGAPFSWVDLGLKVFTLFAFGGWLFFDLVNRRLKSAPLISVLSRGFILLLPLLFADALLDVAFFGSLNPVVVTCCMVVYAPNALLAGCPFCLVTYEMPLLIGVIASYALATALILWSALFKRSASGLDILRENSSVLANALKVSVALAVIGTVLLIVQFALGPLR